jgi:hypothetical protein
MSAPLNPLELERIVLTSSLVYGAFTVWFCPCGDPQTGQGLMSCHLPQIIMATALPLGMILYINRNNLSQR